MSHFAKVKNGKVLEVIVAEQEYIDSLPTETEVSWIQTSYNTWGGVHYGYEKITVDTVDENLNPIRETVLQPVPDGGVALRKNFAGIDMTYDAGRDAFIPPKPYASWTLNETTCLWDSPSPRPGDDKIYEWDEDNTKWVEVELA
mgnify:FL=1|tara:strand:- start:63 stop:494 length:432 start_codon:yes stop_codon:yes gene_type:complete